MMSSMVLQIKLENSAFLKRTLHGWLAVRSNDAGKKKALLECDSNCDGRS